MPPKRKAGKASGAAAGGKKRKVAADEEPATAMKSAISVLKKAPSFRKKTHNPDTRCRLPGAEVHDDYDCMLNQTNIGHNNNKYYVIQVLKQGNRFYAWNRWGRVGEPGQNSMKGPFLDPDKAIDDFKKKFKDKSGNDWNKRNQFVPKSGKYTLLEMGEEEEDDESTVKVVASAVQGGPYQPSKLDAPTQKLLKLIFDTEMFNNAMAQLNLDVKKMPLGKLSKAQIMKGFEVLEELDEVMQKKKKGDMTELTSRFYTVIPHDFGRQRPPVISTAEAVREKMDMLLVLADIELAQAMQKEKETTKTKKEALAPHPADVNYGVLNCELTLVDPKSSESKIISDFIETTKERECKLLHIWRVARKGEPERLKRHAGIENRKLLWHGTNVAVVAAILKTGLRIMPHSGGLVGKGIYFASENGKSTYYVSCAPNGVGIMFLNEVVLGKENFIKEPDFRLTKPPAGYHSVVARGRYEPDAKCYKSLTLDGKKVVVPVGKPVSQTEWTDSCFVQSEYLIYEESQCCIRYMLQFKFD